MKRHMNRQKNRLISKFAVTITAALVVSSCGKEDSGYVYHAEPVEIRAAAETRGAFDLTESSYLTMTWIHQCSENPMPLPAQRNGHLVLEGLGPHQVVRARLHNTDVTLKGRLCAPRHYTRDAVIAVDISAPVFWNDKPTGGTCKRLEAVNKILDSLPTDSRMGLFVFEDDIHESTNGLVGTKVELEAQLKGSSSSMVEVLCDDQLPGGASPGGANFNAAMRKAKELLTTGRGNGTKKELYLITDGHPVPGEPTAEAEQLAQELAAGVVAQGETIPVAIAGAKTPHAGTPSTPSIMEKLITKDVANQKLLKPVTQALDLANDVARFAFNDWNEAFLNHGPKGSSAPQKIDLKPVLNNNFEFTVPAFRLDVSSLPTGHTVKIDIKDTHGLTKTQEIQFVWVD